MKTYDMVIDLTYLALSVSVWLFIITGVLYVAERWYLLDEEKKAEIRKRLARVHETKAQRVDVLLPGLDRSYPRPPARRDLPQREEQNGSTDYEGIRMQYIYAPTENIEKIVQ